MTKTMFIVLLTVLSIGTAHATGKPKPQPQDQSQSQQQGQHQGQNQGQHQTANSEADSFSQSSSYSDSRSESHAEGGSATANSSNAGNTQHVTFQDENDVTIRNTASANPPSVIGSHSCATGGSAGVGVPGFNLSGGRQKIDPGCVAREEARLLHAFGERELAVLYLCASSESLQDKLGVACGPSVTQEELRRRIDFLLKERLHDQEVCKESTERAHKTCVTK